MPNSETFSIKPIRELIDRYKKDGMVIVDPFARNSDIGTITNDLDPETKAMYHKDATDFLCHLDDNIADMVLYPVSQNMVDHIIPYQLYYRQDHSGSPWRLYDT